MNQVNDSKALAIGKVEVQPETLSCSSTSLGLDSWPPDNPQIQTRCSKTVLVGATQVNPVSSLYDKPCEIFNSRINYVFLLLFQLIILQKKSL
jgi:hypothetical protein